MVSSTVARVPGHTPDILNERIRRDIEMSVGYYARHPEEIDERLAELDREWDIERVIQAEAPVLSLLGLGLGLTVNRRLLAMPIVAQSMLLVHAVQGWYPLLPLLRKLRFRTQSEIEQERYALKALRGDLDARQDPPPVADEQARLRQAGAVVERWHA